MVEQKYFKEGRGQAYVWGEGQKYAKYNEISNSESFRRGKDCCWGGGLRPLAPLGCGPAGFTHLCSLTATV